MYNISSKLAIGTVQFGTNYGISNKKGQTPQKEAERILNIARRNQITTLDTAAVYGNSEEVLGDIGVNDFNIVSKFIGTTQKDIIMSLNKSLSNLNVISIYGFLAHRPLDICENNKLWGVLMKLKESSLVKKIGFSFNTIDEVKKIKNSGIIPDLIQVPFNILDYRFYNEIINWKQKKI